jgi:hypothetical protein
MPFALLAQEPRRFGVLYCSNKPHFVKDGVDPIVPMVNQGGVGVVRNALYDEQAIAKFHLRTTDSGDKSSFKGLPWVAFESKRRYAMDTVEM